MMGDMCVGSRGGIEAVMSYHPRPRLKNSGGGCTVVSYADHLGSNPSPANLSSAVSNRTWGWVAGVISYPRPEGAASWVEEDWAAPCTRKEVVSRGVQTAQVPRAEVFKPFSHKNFEKPCTFGHFKVDFKKFITIFESFLPHDLWYIGNFDINKTSFRIYSLKSKYTLYSGNLISMIIFKKYFSKIFFNTEFLYFPFSS